VTTTNIQTMRIPPPPDNEKVVDDKIKEVTLETREENKEINFVDSDNGSISGAVSDDNGNKLPFVEIKILDLTLAIIQTIRTDEIGAYVFGEEVERGDYTVAEVIPDDFPSTCSLSEYDNSPDGNVGDCDTKIDDPIETWRRRRRN
jgi:hypothetical protein